MLDPQAIMERNRRIAGMARGAVEAIDAGRVDDGNKLALDAIAAVGLPLCTDPVQAVMLCGHVYDLSRDRHAAVVCSHLASWVSGSTVECERALGRILAGVPEDMPEDIKATLFEHGPYAAARALARRYRLRITWQRARQFKLLSDKRVTIYRFKSPWASHDDNLVLRLAYGLDAPRAYLSLLEMYCLEARFRQALSNIANAR